MFPEFISILIFVSAVLVTAVMIFLTFFLDGKYPYFSEARTMRILTVAVAVLALAMATFSVVWIAWIVSNWDGRPVGFSTFMGIALVAIWLIAATIGKVVGLR
jgi:hypothetical protein